METNETNKSIERLQKIIKLKQEMINNQEKIIRLYEEKTKCFEELLAEREQKIANTRWIAIFEFLTLFMGTKGKIYDSVYLRSAFSLADLPLTEKNLLWMIKYAIDHLEKDAKYTKQMMKR